MKSVLFKSALTLLFAALTSALFSAEAQKCSKISKEVIGRHIPVSDFEIISSRELEGFCEIIINVNSRLVPLYGNESYLISGDFFQNRKNITKEKMAEVNRGLFLKNRAELDRLTALEYKPASRKGNRVVYMFTEPYCPYCHRAGNDLKKLADHYGFTVKILLLSMHGENGRKKCVEAACRHIMSPESFGFEGYNRVEWKKKPVDEKILCEKGEKLVAETEKLSEKLGIDGVPCFYTDRGDYVSGADMRALEELIRSGQER